MALQKTPTFSQKTSHIVRPSNRASFWKQSIVGSCLAILGLGSSVTHAESIDTTHFAAPKNSMKKFCNQGYIERAGKIYEVSAGHCKTGATGSSAVNKDDITYTRISKLPVGARVTKILENVDILGGAIDQKEVSIQLCVYNIEGETGKNRYCRPFTGIAHFDQKKAMYFVEIPTEIKRWYSENVSDFSKYRMKSASGSPVEYNSELVGTISGIGYNPFPDIEVAGLKPFEGRFYFAPANAKFV